MARQKNSRKSHPASIASLVRGLYTRVARQLKVDPSYVSRVARQERSSVTIEASLIREIRRIIALIKANRGRAGRTKAKRAVRSEHPLLFPVNRKIILAAGSTSLACGTRQATNVRSSDEPSLAWPTCDPLIQA